MIATPWLQDSKYRTIFISDIHLGTRTCRADRLLDFLRTADAPYIYLVGDVVDGWQLRKTWYWAQTHNDVVQKLLRKVRKGAQVAYLPGNHDAFARAYTGLHFGGIAVVNRVVHTTADGRKLLVLHGDEFDAVVTQSKWLASLGSGAYEFAIHLNHAFNWIRRKLGYPYWSLSAWLKHKVKNAFTYIDRFERTLADEARRCGADGIVCGHIHRATIRDVDGIAYYNTGDWVESCTALVEHHDGRLEIVAWPVHPEESAAESDVRYRGAAAVPMRP